MIIQPIRTHEDHQKALARAHELMELDPGFNTQESNELEVLGQIIEIYEKKHFDLGINPEIPNIIIELPDGDSRTVKTWFTEWRLKNIRSRN